MEAALSVARLPEVSRSGSFVNQRQIGSSSARASSGFLASAERYGVGVTKILSQGKRFRNTRKGSLRIAQEPQVPGQEQQ